MSKARRLFDQQHGAPGGTIVEPATLAPVEPEGKLLGQVKTILRQHNELDNILLKTEHLFNSGIEEKVSAAPCCCFSVLLVLIPSFFGCHTVVVPLLAVLSLPSCVCGLELPHARSYISVGCCRTLVICLVQC